MRACLPLLPVILLTSLLGDTARAAAAGEGPSDKKATYVVDPTWPAKPRNFGWGAMPGIAVDRQDNVWIFTRGKPPVQVYDSTGKFVQAWTSEKILIPHHIRVDHEGHIWVTDVGSHTVQKYTADGKLLLMIGTPGEAGCDETHFNKPTDMTILANGDVFVSDGYGNRRIVHLDSKGKFIKAWGEEGTGPGQFALPHSIAADSRGRIYVADRDNARVQIFNTDGKLLDMWDELMTPWGLYVINDDELWICGSSRFASETEKGWIVTPPGDQIMVKLDPDGKVLLRVELPKDAEPPRESGSVDWVHGISLDSQGNIYVGDIMGERVQKFRLKKD
jgi:peptidylamidoglycolate lyase